MQTFVIGGRGGGVGSWSRGNFRFYSAPPLHWSAAVGTHIRMEGWREGGEGEKNRKEEEQDSH